MNARAPATESILGFPVTTLSLQDCVSTMMDWRRGDRAHYLVCANPHSLEMARRDPVFQTALTEADLVVPDGSGIVLASRLQGGAIQHRITGSDVFRALSETAGRVPGTRVFFLGSSAATLRLLQRKYQAEFPTIELAGVYAPPFRDRFSQAQEDAMVEVVNQARARILWVGMTASKQEKWILRNRHRLRVDCVVAIGAVFDFYSGQVTRSSPLFQRLGLEWLPRLLREPRRLWRRNLVSSPMFLLHLLLHRFKA